VTARDGYTDMLSRRRPPSSGHAIKASIEEAKPTPKRRRPTNNLPHIRVEKTKEKGKIRDEIGFFISKGFRKKILEIFTLHCVCN
jgi:hypothetical protein